jgi:outer membrane lipoprotein-sorting protein
MRMLRSASIVLVFVALTILSQSQPLPSGKIILQNVEKGVEGVNDYVVNLEVNVDMERMQAPRSIATMYFKKPDKIHFESPNIALLPREGFALGSSSLLRSYIPTTVGDDTVGTRKVIKLTLAAKEERTRLRQIYVWVDPKQWTIARLQTVPYEGRVVTLTFEYELEKGKYWLPHLLTVDFDLVSRDTPRKPVESAPTPTNPFDEMQRRSPAVGTVTVRYSEYRINTGLSDEIFLPKQEKQ